MVFRQVLCKIQLSSGEAAVNAFNQKTTKKHIVCPFSFSFLSLVLGFFHHLFHEKWKSVHLLCFHVWVFLFFGFFSQNKGRKQGKRINYSRNHLRCVRKLWGQGREYKLLDLSLTNSPVELSSASFEVAEQQHGLAESKICWILKEYRPWFWLALKGRCIYSVCVCMYR